MWSRMSATGSITDSQPGTDSEKRFSYMHSNIVLFVLMPACYSLEQQLLLVSGHLPPNPSNQHAVVANVHLYASTVRNMATWADTAKLTDKPSSVMFTCSLDKCA